MAAPPGRTPMSEPSAVPRTVGAQAALRSASLGQSVSIFATCPERAGELRSRLFITSARPNMPSDTATKSSPSIRSGLPKV